MKTKILLFVIMSTVLSLVPCLGSTIEYNKEERL